MTNRCKDNIVELKCSISCAWF